MLFRSHFSKPSFRPTSTCRYFPENSTKHFFLIPVILLLDMSLYYNLFTQTTLNNCPVSVPGQVLNSVGEAAPALRKGLCAEGVAGTVPTALDSQAQMRSLGVGRCPGRGSKPLDFQGRQKVHTICNAFQHKASFSSEKETRVSLSCRKTS